MALTFFTQYALQSSFLLPLRRSNKMSSQDQNMEKRQGVVGCGRNCLSSCCLHHGVQLPVYYFKTLDKDFEFCSKKDETHVNFLDRILKKWDDCKLRGLFHHDINACDSKILAGDHGFIIHLIEGRDLKKRPTEFRIDKVLQPFDEKKFNFTKIGQEEVLFLFEESDDGNSRYLQTVSVSNSDSPNIIVINVSPISYGHVLLVPHVLDYLPQRIDRQNLLLAVYMAQEAGNSYFRMGYNSLGAFATINHLHFQGYLLREKLPVEKALTQTVATLSNGVEILQLSGYPVKGLVFEKGSNIRELSDTVSSACIFLQDNDYPFNVLISNSGKRIFLLMQWYAKRRALGEVSQEFVETQMNPAVWELSGHIVMKRRKDFNEASEGTVCRFLDETSVTEQQFQEIKEQILAVLHV